MIPYVPAGPIISFAPRFCISPIIKARVLVKMNNHGLQTIRCRILESGWDAYPLS